MRWLALRWDSLQCRFHSSSDDDGASTSSILSGSHGGSPRPSPRPDQDSGSSVSIVLVCHGLGSRLVCISRQNLLLLLQPTFQQHDVISPGKVGRETYCVGATIPTRTGPLTVVTHSLGSSVGGSRRSRRRSAFFSFLYMGLVNLCVSS